MLGSWQGKCLQLQRLAVVWYRPSTTDMHAHTQRRVVFITSRSLPQLRRCPKMRCLFIIHASVCTTPTAGKRAADANACKRRCCHTRAAAASIRAADGPRARGSARTQQVFVSQRNIRSSVGYLCIFIPSCVGIRCNNMSSGAQGRLSRAACRRPHGAGSGGQNARVYSPQGKTGQLSSYGKRGVHGG